MQRRGPADYCAHPNQEGPNHQVSICSHVLVVPRGRNRIGLKFRNSEASILMQIKGFGRRNFHRPQRRRLALPSAEGPFARCRAAIQPGHPLCHPKAEVNSQHWCRGRHRLHADGAMAAAPPRAYDDIRCEKIRGCSYRGGNTSAAAQRNSKIHAETARGAGG